VCSLDVCLCFVWRIGGPGPSAPPGYATGTDVQQLLMEIILNSANVPRLEIAYVVVVVLLSARSELARRSSTDRRASSFTVLRLRAAGQRRRQGWTQDRRLPAGSLFSF